MSTNDNNGFGKFVPGFEFMQQLARQAAGGLMQGMVNHAPVPQLPNLSAWVTPTFNVEELEKRIEELKAVHFWLEQNTRALSATIQALEVQKMTLSTLKSMNVSFADVASALKTKATDSLNTFAGLTPSASHSFTPSDQTPQNSVSQPSKTEFAGLEIPPRRYSAVPTPAAPQTQVEPPAIDAATSETASATTPSGLDPIQGWNTLTQQFQTLAVNAIKDVTPQTVLEAGKHMASTLTREAMKTASDMTATMTRGLVPSASADPASTPTLKVRKKTNSGVPPQAATSTETPIASASTINRRSKPTVVKAATNSDSTAKASKTTKTPTPSRSRSSTSKTR
jgi:hypothetical protein